MALALHPATRFDRSTIMRYLILPLVAVLAFSCCGHELALQPVSSGDGGVAMADREASNADLGSKPGTPPADKAANGDQGKPAKMVLAPTKTSNQKPAMSYNKLTPEEAYVIQQKGTEQRGVGEYTDTKADGLYICRQCNAELYRSKDKFHSNCGWPSFDDEIEGAVDRHEDNSVGMVRVEIVCSNCKGHLGHVFSGERMTEKNTRHCVNSISMRFVAAGETPPPMLVVPPK